MDTHAVADGRTMASCRSRRRRRVTGKPACAAATPVAARPVAARRGGGGPHPTPADDGGGARGGCRLGYHTYGPGAAVATGEPVTFAAYGACWCGLRRGRPRPGDLPRQRTSSPFTRPAHGGGRHPSSVGTVRTRSAAPGSTWRPCAAPRPRSPTAACRSRSGAGAVELEVTAAAQRSCYVYRVRARSARAAVGSARGGLAQHRVRMGRRSPRVPARPCSPASLCAWASPRLSCGSLRRRPVGPTQCLSRAVAAAATGMELAWQIAVPDAYMGRWMRCCG